MRKLVICALAMCVSQGMAEAPLQVSVTPVLGPKLFRDGDVIEIRDVTATSNKLEQGDSVTVKGRARVDSHRSAKLCLLLTQTVGNGSEESDPAQSVTVAQGLQDFELKITIKHQGVLHLTYYESDAGKPFGGTYFGTEKQMKAIETMDLRYYLKQ